MNKTVLFDLDSTLLQMNQDLFIKKYFYLVHEKAKKLGYPADEFLKAFSKSAYAIIDNMGSMTNEELFWSQMSKEYPDIDKLKKEFDDFYNFEFDSISSIVNKTTVPNEIIQILKQKNYRIILATNPLFPKICTYKRMRWAGLNPNDFDYITTYENSCYCKPNHLYYEEIFHKLNIEMEGSIMIGNDLSDDFSDLPKPIFKILVTDYLINTKNLPIDMPSFRLHKLLDYIKENF